MNKKQIKSNNYVKHKSVNKPEAKIGKKKVTNI